MTRFPLPCLVGFALLLASFVSGVARAEVLPVPPIAVTLPPYDINAYGVSVAFGPNDGLMYVWDGAGLLKQDAPLASTYTSIGSVGSGSADAGPIAFSRDASELLIGNGFGGVVGGSHAGLVFTVPASGGDSNTAIATVGFHDNFLAAPLGASNHKFFVNQGDGSFGASSVSVLDNTDGTNISLIENIPGASGGMALNSADRLFVGIGFGPERGKLRSFAISDLENAYDTATPLDWTAGELFNSVDNNSAFGLAFDARGFLFVGGPLGVTVFDTEGNGTLYENNGFTSVGYDPLSDRVLIAGFGDHQGLYPASTFLVPEPATAALAWGFLALVLVRPWQRMRRRMACRHVRHIP